VAGVVKVLTGFGLNWKTPEEVTTEEIQKCTQIVEFDS